MASGINISQQDYTRILLYFIAVEQREIRETRNEHNMLIISHLFLRTDVSLYHHSLHSIRGLSDEVSDTGVEL